MLKNPEENQIDYIIENISYQKFFTPNEIGIQIDLLANYAVTFELVEKIIKDKGAVYFGVDNFDINNKEHLELFKEKFEHDIIPDENLITTWSTDEFPIPVFAKRYKTQQGQNYYFIQFHAGGDIRNNWLKPYVMKTRDTDEEWLLYGMFEGYETYQLLLKDGSELYTDKRWGETKLDTFSIGNSPGEDQFQLLLDGTEELIPRGEAHILAKYFEELTDDELNDFLDLCYRWGKAKPFEIDEETKWRNAYETALNAELGMSYGWTMMARGTMKRLFDPLGFESGLKKFKEANTDESNK